MKECVEALVEQGGARIESEQKCYFYQHLRIVEFRSWYPEEELCKG